MDTKPQAIGAIQLAFVGVAAIAAYSFVASGRDGELRRTCSAVCAMTPDYAGRNRQAPDFELPDLDGKPVKLSDFRGREVILNFWTKTCAPCLEEMPALAKYAELVQRRGDVVVLTISTDESAEDIRSTLQSVLGGDAVPFITLMDPEAKIVSDVYGTKLFPETWFVDPAGIIRARFDGVRKWDSPLALEFAETWLEPAPCPIAFENRQARGPSGELCDEMPTL